MNPNNYRYGQYYFNPTWAPTPTSCSQPGVVYNNVVLFTVAPDGTHYFHQTYGGQFTLPETNTEPPIPPSYPELQNKPRASRRRKSNECRTPEAESETKDNVKEKLCDNSDKFREEKCGKTDGENNGAPQDEWVSGGEVKCKPEENMAPQDEWTSDCEVKCGKTEENMAPQDEWTSDWEDGGDFDVSTDFSQDEDDEDPNQEDHNQGDPGQRHTHGRQNRDPRSSIVSMFPLPNMNLFGGPPDS